MNWLRTIRNSDRNWASREKCLFSGNFREFPPTQWLGSSSTTCGKKGNCKQWENEQNVDDSMHVSHSKRTISKLGRPSARDITAFESSWSRWREQSCFPRAWYLWVVDGTCWHWTRHKPTIDILILVVRWIPFFLFHDQRNSKWTLYLKSISKWLCICFWTKGKNDFVCTI